MYSYTIYIIKLRILIFLFSTVINSVGIPLYASGNTLSLLYGLILYNYTTRAVCKHLSREKILLLLFYALTHTHRGEV